MGREQVEYEAHEPAFLRRMRQQAGGGGHGGDADRHETAQARIRQIKEPDEDDGPVIVNEANDTVSKEEFAALAEKPETVESERKSTDLAASTQKVSEAGVLKKRKAGRAISAQAHEDEDNNAVAVKKTADKPVAQPARKKAKKKKATGQLSFADGDENEENG